MASVLCRLVVVVSTCQLGLANNLRRSENDEVMVSVSEEDVQMSLLEEIEVALKLGNTDSTLSSLDEELRPMFNSLPTNEFGGLGHSTVRYALHRLFVERHGWYIKGLNPMGGPWNTSSPTGIIKDRVPSYIQGLFEQHLGGHGFGLRELTVFAATIEHLVQDEALTRLMLAYEAKGLALDDRITDAEADDVLDSYMTMFIGSSSEEDDVEGEEVSDTTLFVRDTRMNVQYSEQSRTNPFVETGPTFDTMGRVVDQISEKFGRFQDGECKRLKSALVEHDVRGTGRVPLSDFYSRGLTGTWQFQENVNYLRQLGALDETNSMSPRVIIPNYISSPTNCIAASPSSFYSVCCLNECEGLMAHLERDIAAPEASPERILQLVSHLSSDTVDAPRNLSSALLDRLNDIASEHSGMVPLHGRLFTQWMHHAYPRECPFPHVAGTTSPVSPDEWMQETGESCFATDEEIQQYVGAESQQPVDPPEMADAIDSLDGDEDVLPWLPQEELLVVRPKRASEGSMIRTVLQIVMPICVLGSFAANVVKATKSSAKGVHVLAGDLSGEKVAV